MEQQKTVAEIFTFTNELEERIQYALETGHECSLTVFIFQNMRCKSMYQASDLTSKMLVDPLLYIEAIEIINLAMNDLYHDD